MELLHKTIAQLPQGQNDSNLGAGTTPATTHSLSIERPSSPSLNKIHAASPSYEQKIFEPSTTEVSTGTFSTYTERSRRNALPRSETARLVLAHPIET